MYIKGVEIVNIKGIEHLLITFPEGAEAGWHVLIGDNGSGKTTILRSIALTLLDLDIVGALKPDWDEWLPRNSRMGRVTVWTSRENNDSILGMFTEFTRGLNSTSIAQHRGVVQTGQQIKGTDEETLNLSTFSAGFGPFRRFSGGSGEWDEVFDKSRYSRLAAHLTLFEESVAITPLSKWLKELDYKNYEGKTALLADVIEFINAPDFLPGGIRLAKVGSDGVFFETPDNKPITIGALSDGFRSILSLTLELIRQLSIFYPNEKMFTEHQAGYLFVPFAGVVLIDEIDAHLHPTWQVRIGDWFTKYFPNIQFIVTTHSPLICRAAEKGTIWRLAEPYSDSQTKQVVGDDKNRLVFGDILDAYGTELFGSNVTQSPSGVALAEEIAALSVKSFDGVISEEDKKRLNALKSMMPTANL